MNQLLLLAGVVIVACILMNRIAAKLPLPSLLLFIGLGMCFGVDGFFKIPFDDYELSEAILFGQSVVCHVLWWFWNKSKDCKTGNGKSILTFHSRRSDDRSAGRGSSACAVGSGLDGRDFDRIGHCIYRCSVRI